MREEQLRGIEMDAAINIDMSSVDILTAATIHSLVAEVRKLRAALESIQWGVGSGHGSHWNCRACAGCRDCNGHEADCPILEALR